MSTDLPKPSDERLATLLNVTRSRIPLLRKGKEVSYEMLALKVLPGIIENKLWPDGVARWLSSLIAEDKGATIPADPALFEGSKKWHGHFLAYDHAKDGKIKWYHEDYAVEDVTRHGPERFTVTGEVTIPSGLVFRFRLERIWKYLCTLVAEPRDGKGQPFSCTFVIKYGDVFCGTWTGVGAGWQLTAYRVFLSPRELEVSELKAICEAVPIAKEFELPTW